MNAHDHERIAAARSKQRRKLERWFARQDQAGLAARRLAAELQFAAGEPIPLPEPYPDEVEAEPLGWDCAA